MKKIIPWFSKYMIACERCGWNFTTNEKSDYLCDGCQDEDRKHPDEMSVAHAAAESAALE